MRPWVKLGILHSMLWISACQPFSQNFEILTFEALPKINDKSEQVCSDFNFEIGKVSEFFELATPVSNERFQGEAIVLPCGYKGKLKNREQTYEWQINAAGTGYLFNREKTQYFICEATCCKRIKGLC